MSQNIFSKNAVLKKRKNTMNLKKMLEIYLTKTNGFLEKHNTKIGKELKKLKSCNVIAKILQLLIKKILKRG